MTDNSRMSSRAMSPAFLSAAASTMVFAISAGSRTRPSFANIVGALHLSSEGAHCTLLTVYHARSHLQNRSTIARAVCLLIYRPLTMLARHICIGPVGTTQARTEVLPVRTGVMHGPCAREQACCIKWFPAAPPCSILRAVASGWRTCHAALPVLQFPAGLWARPLHVAAAGRRTIRPLCRDEPVSL